MALSQPPNSKDKSSSPVESTPNEAPKSPSGSAPQVQQATYQQQGSAPQTTGSNQSGTTAPKGAPPSPAKGSDGVDAPSLPIGPSPDLQQAYTFLNNYIQNMGTASLPPDMLNGGEPDTPSPLNNLGQVLPSTVTGDIKKFPNYSLATGAPNSPGLPTGLTPPVRPVMSQSQQLVGGLPAQQVKLNQRKIV